MKKLFVFVIFIFVLCSIKAQQLPPITDTIHVNSYEEAMILTYGLLPKSHFPSGYLLNKGSLIPKMSSANGLLNDSSFNMLEFYFIQNSIRSAYSRPDSFPGYLVLDSLKDKYIENNNVLPWGLIDMETHIIRDSAFYDGSMGVSNYRFVENTTILNKLYSKIKLFCAVPLNMEIYTLNPQFVIKTDFVFSNNTNTINSIQVDLDDGIGYRVISLNSNFQASYSTGGYKEFVTRIIYNNGDTLYSRSEINIIDNNIQSLFSLQSYPYTAFDYTYIINQYSNNSSSDYPSAFSPAFDQNAYAEIGVWYGCNNSEKKLRKPFVIFAGYNPKKGKSLAANNNPAWYNDGLGALVPLDGWRGPLYETYDGFFTDLSKNANFGNGPQAFGSNGTRLLDKVRSEGFDVVIVRMYNGIGYLQNNAFLASLVLEDINKKILDEVDNIQNPGAALDPEAPGYPNSTKIKKAKHELIVAGYSAGALSTRMALLLMEYENINSFGNFNKCNPSKADRIKPHRVKIWIGMDHETQGSNVPIGQQIFMDFQRSLQFLPANAADVANSIICQQALALLKENGVATQNTLYHIDNLIGLGNSSWNVGHHSDFDTYYNNLASITHGSYPQNLKGYPKDCYRISVSQGNANGINQVLSSNSMLLYNESPTFLCINPMGTSYGIGNIALKATPYRRAEARVLTNTNNNVFSCKVGTSFRTILLTWHVTFNHWKYHADNYIYDQDLNGNVWRAYDNAPASTLPSHLILGNKLPLSSPTLVSASLFWCNFKDFNKYQHGFSPTVSGLDLHLPGVNSLPRLPNLNLIPGNVPGGLNLMQQNNYNIGSNNSPNNDFGFPHLTFPANNYDYTPMDAIWANTTNNQNYDDNTIHVEDPNPNIADFLVEEIAPYTLYLSKRTIKANVYNCGDGQLIEKYYADFEARNSILAGNQTIYEHNVGNEYPRKRTPPGDFVVDNGSIVTMRANNGDGNSAVVLGAGFSAKHGSVFRAYVNGDSYCAPFSYGQRTIPPSNNYALQVKEPRPIATKRVNAQKLTTVNKKINVSLYPNPSNGVVKYILSNQDIFDYTITDLTGKLLQTGVLKEGMNDINLSSFEKGIYLITIKSVEYKQTDRIILQ